jgi:2',3'-cyclic-nucleotide 2'-phosphodiesterase (5'-nucleotidase family)
MVKLKKYPALIKEIVLFLTFFLAFSCAERKYHVTRVEGREIPVTEQNTNAAEIDAYINPYRENIDKDLSTVLAYAPQTLDKTGQWQTTIGNLMADATMDFGNRVFVKRENRNIDFCLLNIGGIRSIIPKGNVTTRTAFEIMPFENSLIVTELNSEQVLELIDYIIAEKKAHPVSGVTFSIGADNKAADIRVHGQPFNPAKTYFVVTSDYLSNGGDKMDFFKKSVRNYDLDYKLRNVLIDYFKEVDTIPVITDVRIRATK